jgi:hypothetical protein
MSTEKVLRQHTTFPPAPGATVLAAYTGYLFLDLSTDFARIYEIHKRLSLKDMEGGVGGNHDPTLRVATEDQAGRVGALQRWGRGGATRSYSCHFVACRRLLPPPRHKQALAPQTTVNLPRAQMRCGGLSGIRPEAIKHVTMLHALPALLCVLGRKSRSGGGRKGAAAAERAPAGAFFCS